MRRWRRVRFVSRVLVVALVAGLAGCASGHSAPRTGLITGQLLVEQSLGQAKPVRGYVRALQGSKVVATVGTSSSGYYRIRVPAGRYDLKGRSKSSGSSCLGVGLVVVSAGRSTTMPVICLSSAGSAGSAGS
jgi:hypothetical protein